MIGGAALLACLVAIAGLFAVRLAQSGELQAAFGPHATATATATPMPTVDGDTGGQSAAVSLGRDLRDAGVCVVSCKPPAGADDDGLGKDWAARWRVAEWDGLAPIYDALAALDRALDAQRAGGAALAPVRHTQPDSHGGAVSDQQSGQSSPVAVAAVDAPAAAPGAEALAELWALARADPIVTQLEASGYVLADVYAVTG